MLSDFPLWPEQASTIASDVDALMTFLCVVTGAVSVLIFVVIFYLAIKYRRTPENQLAQDYEPPKALEAAWIIIPFLLFMFMFVWGSWLYFRIQRVPDNALDIYATGKQWMWKFQHPGGQREINTLHVPVGRPIRITMASEDVIHSLYFPAFRVKMDVLPNRYRTMWFQATRTGRFHIFCAEYCGTMHSGMTGWVEVMEPTDYQKWLAGQQQGPAQPWTGQIKQLTASTLDDAYAFLHSRQGFLIDHAARLRRKPNVERQIVGLGIDLVQICQRDPLFTCD